MASVSVIRNALQQEYENKNKIIKECTKVNPSTCPTHKSEFKTVCSMIGDMERELIQSSNRAV